MTKINNRHSPLLKSQMESIQYFVAEWVSVKEMKALQGACMLTSMRARGQENDNTRNSCPTWMTKCGKNCQMIGKDICWKKKKAPPCEPTLCRESFQNRADEFLVENFGIKEVQRHCWQNRVAKREREAYFPCASRFCTMAEKAWWHV